MTFPLLNLLNYLAAIFLVLYGIYAMMTKQNLIRKVLAMAFLQTGVILFFISISYKSGAKIPILSHAHQAVNVAHFANPLPHALMLTAIVVGVSTLGVALVLVVSLYRAYQTIEENEILEQLNGKKKKKKGSEKTK